MNVGIIGLGRIGKVHIEALKSLKNTTIKSISDIDETACKVVAAKYNIPDYSTDFKELINNGNIDAIWVCSPSNLHYRHVYEALKNNKYVFCEKPLETEIDKIKSLITDFPDIHKRLMVGFNRRFDADFAFAKQNIGVVGKPTIIKITSRDPSPPPTEYIRTSGGIYKDMTIHDFDMARFITDSEVSEVFAMGNINYIAGIEGVDVDTSLVTLKFKNGAICTIDNSRLSAYGYDQRLEILGDKGMLQVHNKKVHQCSFHTKEHIREGVLENFFLDRYKEAYKKEAVVFYECISEKKEFPVTAFDALKALELAEACKKSLEEKSLVILTH